MKRNLSDIKTALLSFCILLLIGTAITVQTQAQNKTDSKDQPKISADEQKAAKKIEEAKDIATKFQAVNDFLTKYPKSTLRPKIAEYVAGDIVRLTDANQKVTYGEQFFSTFSEPGETDLISPYLIEAYLNTKKFDEAFQVGENYLARHADDALVLSQLATNGSSLAYQGKGNYSDKSLQYANTAIELIESNKKPANFTDEKWATIKTTNLPLLYQSTGVLLMQSGKREDAKSKLTKAAELNPKDPFNYFLAGRIAEEEYQETAKAYQATAPGKQKDDLLVKANSQLDKVIDYYAHALAAADGNAAFQSQLRPAVEDYYKYRHNKSLDGLQELINKYKPKP